MLTAQVAYLNMNQGLGTEPFWKPHRPSFKALDKLVDILREMPCPRIFGASEVSQLEWLSRQNVYQRIKDGARFKYAEYGGNFKFPLAIKFEVGNALFSDLPIDDKKIGAFPCTVPFVGAHSALLGSRTFLMNKVTHDNGSLYVIISHLSLLFKSHRMTAARLLAKIGRRIDGPAILMLDANSPPVYVPDSKRYNYGSNIFKYLWFYLVHGKTDGDWTSDDNRLDRTINALEYGFPKDMCPVSCYKKVLHSDENKQYKTFENRIIDYSIGKDVPDAKCYHIVDEKISDHKMIAFKLELPNKYAICRNLEGLLIPPEETLPCTIVKTASTVPRIPQRIWTAAKSAGAYASNSLKSPLKKLAKRIESIF
ncbi:MAG: hypothetical protein HY363_05875 [Candidatus Aenigmarchaeota archaeon]|nr:hypothetical protein [Candidatus Aenigmarchaeota archaeon]